MKHGITSSHLWINRRKKRNELRIPVYIRQTRSLACPYVKGYELNPQRIVMLNNTSLERD